MFLLFQPFQRVPMFGFVLLGFLSICVILAVACFLAFRSGKDGTTKLGTGAGCLISAALVFIAGLGALGCTAIAFLNAPNEMLRHGPLRRVEAHWPDVTVEPSPSVSSDDATSDSSEGLSAGLRIRIEMSGGDPTEVSRWFREHTDGDMSVAVETVQGFDGPRTRIDIELPISDSELREIRREFERELPNLNLPSGVSVELKSEHD